MSKKKMKKPLKITLISVGSVLLVVILVAISYLGYVIGSYSRIGDTALEINNNQTATIKSSDIDSKSFKITSYNIGFGAYERDYSFFMDSSVFKEEYVASQGRKQTTGKHAHALSKERALFNTNGAYDTILKVTDLDFALYQEVDTSSTRSYKVNQVEIGNEKHAGYASVYGVNYHSAYLAYPFNEPIGKSNSGISTYSKYKIADANRYEFKITDSFFGKFFDLDRSFTVSEIAIEGSTQKLYIFNVHMSAYDENGVVRKVQLQQLKEAYKLARDIDGEDNFVIIGGDFNHDLVIDNPLTRTEYKNNVFNAQETDGLNTDWYNYLRLNPSLDGQTVTNLWGEEEVYQYDFKDTDITAHGPTNYPTCRDASINFLDKNENGIIDNFMVTIDGFLVSDNIEVVSIETLGSAGSVYQQENLLETDPRYGYGFVYSDHNPVLMEFKIKSS